MIRGLDAYLTYMPENDRCGICGNWIDMCNHPDSMVCEVCDGILVENNRLISDRCFCGKVRWEE